MLTEEYVRRVYSTCTTNSYLIIICPYSDKGRWDISGCFCYLRLPKSQLCEEDVLTLVNGTHSHIKVKQNLVSKI